MKNTVAAVIAALLLLWVMVFVNCSNPLEDIDAGGFSPPGPGTVHDTITDIDSIFSMDTVMVVDTLVIIGSDSGWSHLLCSFVSHSHPEIVWMFQNGPGDYLLQFTALPESEQPAQKLSVDIDGEVMEWIPATDRDLITEAALGQNALVRIFSKKPPSMGHSVHICLTISKL